MEFFLVFVKSTLVGERLIANFASELSLTGGVCQFVPLQMLLADVAFITKLTLENLFTSVNSRVVHQIFLLHESVFADSAFKWKLCGVDALMDF